jgi:hypothetical protein
MPLSIPMESATNKEEVEIYKAKKAEVRCLVLLNYDFYTLLNKLAWSNTLVHWILTFMLIRPLKSQMVYTDRVWDLVHRYTADIRVLIFEYCLNNQTNFSPDIETSHYKAIKDTLVPCFSTFYCTRHH